MISCITEPPGVRYVPQYITWEEHTQLLDVIDRQVWLNDLKRRVQHYGYRYDYKSQSPNRASTFLGLLPEWVNFFLLKITNDGLTTTLPNQLIINEYKPGQGIAQHVDCIPCFGSTIFSVSLGSSCPMSFKSVESEDEIPLLLEPCSLLVLEGPARYKWKHGIAPRKTDFYNGQIIQRKRRVSLTFRSIIHTHILL